ncbi:LTA synthase family protein [Nocardioides sp. zg-ZUI104]|uniref:LTA synthase family protein n=1 Tax=Nocardioides faecalis TaxID=2803858 RepID=UPI001BCC4C00|nr:LTA synthase family protein [Nocardioides faecalis]MBS4751382.1 LTA synthase family protein [Nocardioides faecalis]
MSTSVGPAARAGQALGDAPEETLPEETVPPSLRQVLLRGAKGSLQAALAISVALQASTLGLFLPRWLKDLLFDGGGFWFDTLLVWALIGFCWALLGRLWWSFGAVAALALVLGVVTLVKIPLRREPVYPSDIDFLREPGFLTSMVPLPLLILGGLAVGGVLVAAARIGRRMQQRWPRPRLWALPRRQALAVIGLRLGVLALTGVMLLHAFQFNHQGNAWRGLYEARGESWRYWNQTTNYRSNGFIGGFLYNMPTEAMAAPASYDAEVMARLADRYTAAAERINATRDGSLADVNVVLVLSESFTDPTELEGFELERDPIPHTRALMARTTSGHMLAQMYGGGTANMEFETLTGQSLRLFRPQMLSPYQMLVPGERDYPSAVGWFRAQGHRAVAVHPYRVGMYKRQQVYHRFGFQEFVHDTTLPGARTIDDNPFISDASAFDEVLRQIDDSEAPLLVNLVTMQNHIPVTDNYPDPIGVEGVSGGQAERIGQYARGLEHSDAAFADFLDALDGADEETIVLFYGDHLPGIYSSDTQSANDGLRLHRTPFLVWSNRAEKNVVREVPITSPAFFLPLLYEVADAPVPPYLALLDEVREHVGAMAQGRLLDTSGDPVQPEDLDDETKQLLADLRLVQYDFSIGERFAVDRMWPGSVVTNP